MTPELAKTLCKAVALVSVACGAGGIALCVPILLTCHTFNVLGAASLPLIAGAVLVGTGLLTFAVLIKEA